MNPALLNIAVGIGLSSAHIAAQVPDEPFTDHVRAWRQFRMLYGNYTPYVHLKNQRVGLK